MSPFTSFPELFDAAVGHQAKSTLASFRMKHDLKHYMYTHMHMNNPAD